MIREPKLEPTARVVPTRYERLVDERPSQTLGQEDLIGHSKSKQVAI